MYIGHIVGMDVHRDHPGEKVKNIRESYAMAWGNRYSKFQFNNPRFAKEFGALNPNLVKN